MIAKSDFHSYSVLAENLIAVELRKLEVEVNKPIYMGMYILESLLERISPWVPTYATYRDKCKIMYTNKDCFTICTIE